MIRFVEKEKIVEKMMNIPTPLLGSLILTLMDEMDEAIECKTKKESDNLLRKVIGFTTASIEVMGGVKK